MEKTENPTEKILKESLVKKGEKGRKSTSNSYMIRRILENNNELYLRGMISLEEFNKIGEIIHNALIKDFKVK